MTMTDHDYRDKAGKGERKRIKQNGVTGCLRGKTEEEFRGRIREAFLCV